MVEADRAADEMGGLAAPAVAEDLVAIADAPVREIVDARRPRSGLAHEAMPLPVRHQHQVAGLELAPPRSRYLEPAPAGSQHVEGEASLDLGKLKPPGRRQLRRAVRGARHAQEVQRFTERVHAPGLAGGSAIVHQTGTDEHERATNEHGASYIGRRYWTHANPAGAARCRHRGNERNGPWRRARGGGGFCRSGGGRATAAWRACPGRSMVTATFAALEAISQALALELGPLRVNTIRPGLVDSEMWSFLDDRAREQLRAKVRAAFPARRIGSVEDIGHAAVFLM